MRNFQKPMRLRPGDKVAVLSPSWGSLNLYPPVFDAGLAYLRDVLDVSIQEYPTTRMAPSDTVTKGQSFGGCISVLEFLKGTERWPKPEFWQGKILFLETSEDKPTVDQVTYILRNYGMQGIFDQLAGLLFARPEGYTPEERETLFRAIVGVVAGEFGRGDLPIVAEMDFGYEAPQCILPLGVMAEIDCRRQAFRLVEPCVL